jgi:hypothetical protein
VLPVFSFEEEADMFLRLGDYDNQWRTRESCAGELVSVRYGPCADVKSVALDPLPGMFEDGTVVVVGVGSGSASWDGCSGVGKDLPEHAEGASPTSLLVARRDIESSSRDAFGEAEAPENYRDGETAGPRGRVVKMIAG